MDPVDGVCFEKHSQTCSHRVPRVFGSGWNDSTQVAKRDAVMRVLAYRVEADVFGAPGQITTTTGDERGISK